MKKITKASLYLILNVPCFSGFQGTRNCIPFYKIYIEHQHQVLSHTANLSQNNISTTPSDLQSILSDVYYKHTIIMDLN